MAQDPGKSPDFTVRKKVDESWKDAVKKEADPPAPGPDESDTPEASFPFFVSSIGMQALIALGEIANPVTGQKGLELSQAERLIDVLLMLAKKTNGNLSPDEKKVLEGLLYELQMKFVEKKQK